MAHAHRPPAVPPLAPGFLPNARLDLIAGFLVFLIAMPLCLAIARASGYPPVAGIWTAVIGGVICSLISNSQLTIKGPAAGLIVIVYGAVTDLGSEFGAGLPDADRAFLGYKLALGIGVTAGVIQILFGLFRAGRLADLFPLTPVHGMLASIGLIIIAKQAYEVIGATPEKGAGPLQLYAGLPSALGNINPEIAVIGLVSLLILFGLPLLRLGWVRKVPAQLVVLVAAVGLGVAFDLEHRHTYLFPDDFFHLDHRGEFEVGPRFLVDMPEVLEHPAEAFALPDFCGVATATGLQYILLFCLIGSLESLLSAKAIELVDPWRRKTNFDRDLLAVGVANTLASAVGALPMISEIVRSKANIDSGARIGIGVGIALEVAFHLRHGCPVGGLLKSDVTVVPEGDKLVVLVVLVVRRAAVFSNWLGVRAAILREAEGRDEVVIDLTHTRLVDHSVMEKLHQLADDFTHAGKRLTLVGLDDHTPLSDHPHAARKSVPRAVGVG